MGFQTCANITTDSLMPLFTQHEITCLAVINSHHLPRRLRSTVIGGKTLPNATHGCQMLDKEYGKCLFSLWQIFGKKMAKL